MARVMRPALRLEINPIIVKELRSRMRGARAFLTLTGVLVVLGGVIYLLYRMALASTAYNPGSISAQIGQMLFLALAFMELLMVCAIAPAVTAGAISSEQERQTYEMLLATPLRPASILWGKLVSALSYVFLLVCAAVPMSSLIFIFGGVTLRDMLKALVILLTVMVTFGILGLFMSAWLRRTARATVLSYLVLAALTFGSFLIYGAYAVIRQGEPPRWLLAANPVTALFSALVEYNQYGGLPFGWFGGLGMLLGGDVRLLTGATVSQISIPRPMYHYTLPLYGGLALVLYWLSTRLILPARRWRLRWKDLLLPLLLFGLYGGAVATAFAATAHRYENARPGVAAIQPGPNVVTVEKLAFPLQKDGTLVEPAGAAYPAPPEAYPPPGEAPTPTPFPYPPPLATRPFSEAEQAQVYGVILQRLFLVEAFDNLPPEDLVLFVSTVTDDAFGDPAMTPYTRQHFSQGLKEALAAQLQRLLITEQGRSWGEQFFWTDTGYPAVDPATGQYPQLYAVLEVGNIHFQSDGSILVSSRLTWTKGGSAKTFRLSAENEEWRVAEETWSSQW
jgi:ABC-2 type transport system permease protein